MFVLRFAMGSLTWKKLIKIEESNTEGRISMPQGASCRRSKYASAPKRILSL